jgi:hypothetical protein
VDWARQNCTGFGTPHDKPLAVYNTTAGEVRRRISAASAGTVNILGSNWNNEHAAFIVAFGGDYAFTPDPLGRSGALPPADVCIYMGNGKTDPGADNGLAFITVLGDRPPTIEGLWGWSGPGD